MSEASNEMKICDVLVKEELELPDDENAQQLDLSIVKTEFVEETDAAYQESQQNVSDFRINNEVDFSVVKIEVLQDEKNEDKSRLSNSGDTKKEPYEDDSLSTSGKTVSCQLPENRFKRDESCFEINSRLRPGKKSYWCSECEKELNEEKQRRARHCPDREKDRDRQRKMRSLETEEQRSARLQKDRERKRKKLEQETETERLARLDRLKKYNKIRREKLASLLNTVSEDGSADETKRLARLDRLKKYNKIRREKLASLLNTISEDGSANESPESKKMILAYLRAKENKSRRQKEKIRQESPNSREKRLAYLRNRQKERLAEKSRHSREVRLAGLRNRQKNRLAKDQALNDESPTI